MPLDDLYDATPPGSSANEHPTSTNSKELSATVLQFAISPPAVSSTPRVTLPGASRENVRPTSNNSVGVSGSRYATPVTSSATSQPWAPVLRRGRPANPRRMAASSSGPSRAVAGPSRLSTSAPANPFEPGSSVSNSSAFGALVLGSSKSIMTATFSPEVPQQLSNSSRGPRVSDTASSKPNISVEAAEFVPGSSTSDPDGSGPSETEPSGSTMKATSPEFVPGGSSGVDKGKGKADESSSDEESAEMEFGSDESPPEIPTGPRSAVLPPANGTLVLSYGYFHQPERRQNFRFVHPNRASNPQAEESHRYHPVTRAELRAIFELKANDDPDFQAEIQKIMSESPEDWLKRILTRASKEKDRLRSIMMQMQEEKENFLAQIRTLEQLVYELQLRQQLVPQPVEARVLYEYQNGNSFPETMMELKAGMHKLTRERDKALQEIKKLEKGLKNLETEFTNGADEALRNRNDELLDRNRLLENYDLKTQLLLDGKEEEILDLQRRYTYLNRFMRKELKGAECTYDAVVAIVREAVSDGASKDKSWSDIKKLQNHFNDLTHGKIERLQKEHKEEKENLRKEYEDKLCAQSYTACKEKSVLEGQKCGLEKVLNDVQEYFSTILDDKSCLELENATLRDDVANANEKSKKAEAQAAYRKERFEQMSKNNRKLKDEREAAQKENRELKVRLGLLKMESNNMRGEARSCQRAESRFEVGARVS